VGKNLAIVGCVKRTKATVDDVASASATSISRFLFTKNIYIKKESRDRLVSFVLPRLRHRLSLSKREKEGEEEEEENLRTSAHTHTKYTHTYTSSSSSSCASSTSKQRTVCLSSPIILFYYCHQLRQK
jgi:hypothetical protein